MPQSIMGVHDWAGGREDVGDKSIPLLKSHLKHKDVNNFTEGFKIIPNCRKS